MIEKIEFKDQKLEVLKQIFDLGRVTIIIGKNGSGKSTFINNIKNKQISRMNATDNEAVDFMYKDFSEDMRSLKPEYQDSSDKMMESVLANTHSSGEHSYEFYIEQLRDIKDKTILLDEPERGLDIDNLDLLEKIIKENKSCQFIIATHSPVLLGGFIYNDEKVIIPLTQNYTHRMIDEIQ